MTTKELLLKTANELPEDATIDDAFYRLYVLYKIQQGLDDIENGRTVSHEEVVQRMKRWLQ